MSNSPKVLKRSFSDKKIFDVCGGLAEYFGLDSGMVRLAFVIFGIFGAGVLVYIVLAVAMS